MPTVYLNGEYLPLAEARISVLDRGFTFGDGVYEVLLVYKRKIFRLEEHLNRLDNSLAAIYMDNPLNHDEWCQVMSRLIKNNPVNDQSLYLQVTRGVSERDHAIHLARNPTVFAMSNPVPQRNFTAGIAAITCEDIRWKLCNIKAITLLPSILLRHQALQSGATEAILLKNGKVTEGAASNVFIVTGDKIKTPPKDGSLLPGITRDLVVELLQQEGIVCEESVLTEKELVNADEIWITSSTWEIVPVIKLDNRPVGNGQPGKFWQQAMDIYTRFKNSI
jgi:D-alanine transaminase